MNEEIKKALEARFKKMNDDLAEMQKNGATQDDIQKLLDTMKVQADGIEALENKMKAEKIEKILSQYKDFLVENIDKINEIKAAGKGSVTFVPKDVGAMSTASGGDITTPDPNQGTVLGSFNLRNDNPLLGLAATTSTSSAYYRYTDLLPKEGDYAFVAEAGLKPQLDFKWENRGADPKKAAGHMVLSTEVVQDIAGLMSSAREYLQKKHDLFKVNGIYFGDGTGENPEGATVVARLFAAGDLANAITSPNIMDVINAVFTDIYMTTNYADEMEHEANVVLMNPVDFMIQFVAAKEANTGHPLYPTATLFNEVRMNGVLIKPWRKIPAGKIFVADMSKYNVVNYVPFQITIGWINDQFITNQFTMVGESRFYAFVKQYDRNAFVYDDIATIQAAIATP